MPIFGLKYAFRTRQLEHCKIKISQAWKFYLSQSKHLFNLSVLIIDRWALIFSEWKINFFFKERTYSLVMLWLKFCQLAQKECLLSLWPLYKSNRISVCFYVKDLVELMGFLNNVASHRSREDSLFYVEDSGLAASFRFFR